MMLSAKNLVLTLAAMLALTVVSRAAGPVAKVVLVKGDVTLRRAAIQDKDIAVLKLEEFEPIYEDDVLEVSDGAQVTLILRKDYLRCRIEKAGSYTMRKESVAPKEGVIIEVSAAGKRLREEDYARMLELSRPGVTVARSVTKITPPISPVGGSTVITQRPSFRWPSFAEAQRYRVEVWEDIENQPRRIIWSKETTDTSVDFDGEPLPSRPGTTYRWAVEAQDSSQLWTKVNEATFRIANEDNCEFASRLMAAAQGDDVVEIALCAKTLSEKGMVVEAIEVYEHLIEREPDSIRFRLDLIGLYRRAGLVEKADRQIKLCDELGYRFVDDSNGELICE